MYKSIHSSGLNWLLGSQEIERNKDQKSNKITMIQYYYAIVGDSNACIALKFDCKD